MKLLNAFSLGMLPAEQNLLKMQVERLTLAEAKSRLEAGIESCVGHADTAAILTSLLGKDVAFNRASVTLAKGETALVAQYKGARLPEGTKVLPEGSTFEWIAVTVTAE